MKVPRQSIGAELSVVMMKLCNKSGVKRQYYSVLCFSQPEIGRN